MSLNEKLEALIPAGKIASLNTGEMVGLIAADVQQEFTGEYKTSAINCKVNLDLNDIKKEEENYKDLPVYYDFGDKKEEILRSNFLKINNEIEELVTRFAPPPEPEKERAQAPPKAKR
jgi:hypothetical protein